MIQRTHDAGRALKEFKLIAKAKRPFGLPTEKVVERAVSASSGH
jgi:hypothetical protein